jgi:hypothetical protein
MGIARHIHSSLPRGCLGDFLKSHPSISLEEQRKQIPMHGESQWNGKCHRLALDRISHLRLFSSQLNFTVQTNCTCSCWKIPRQVNTPQCSNHGTDECGVCTWDKGSDGREWQCDPASTTAESKGSTMPKVIRRGNDGRCSCLVRDLGRRISVRGEDNVLGGDANVKRCTLKYCVMRRRGQRDQIASCLVQPGQHISADLWEYDDLSCPQTNDLVYSDSGE